MCFVPRGTRLPCLLFPPSSEQSPAHERHSDETLFSCPGVFKPCGCRNTSDSKGYYRARTLKRWGFLRSGAGTAAGAEAGRRLGPGAVCGVGRRRPRLANPRTSPRCSATARCTGALWRSRENFGATLPRNFIGRPHVLAHSSSITLM